MRLSNADTSLSFVLTVIGFHSGDTVATAELLAWIKDLGSALNHDALLVADAATPWKDCVELNSLAQKIFRKSELIFTGQSVSGWPQGPNSLFFTAAEHINANKRGPWLWLEPDAIPLRHGWIDALEEEWLSLRHNQKFLGHIYDFNIQGGPPKGMSGVAIYAEDAFNVLQQFKEMPGAWDYNAAEIMLKYGAPSSLIQHFFGEKGLPPTFAEKKETTSPINTFTLWNIKLGAVLFHRNKDGTLINILRRRINPDPKVKGPKAFLQMGRYGDIILLLPAFHEWSKRTGFNTVVITSEEHASVFEGVSYVQAIPLDMHWHHEINKARQWADINFPGCVTTQLHGANWGAVPDDMPSYSMTMWKRTGLLEEYAKLPLIFDRRDANREKQLLDQVNRRRYPMLLVNFSGITSPFAMVPEVMNALEIFRGKYTVVNLGDLRAARIYDLLGLMDNAIGMLTIDTATLHLAAASPMPYVAFCRDDGQSGSIPKGNCVLKVPYNRTAEMLPEIVKTVGGWIK